MGDDGLWMMDDDCSDDLEILDLVIIRTEYHEESWHRYGETRRARSDK